MAKQGSSLHLVQIVVAVSSFLGGDYFSASIAAVAEACATAAIS
jgi:hypothetical protein